MLSVLGEGHYVVMLRIVSFHSGRPDDHAGDGESDNRRPLLQQLLDKIRRNVTLNHVSIHRCDVARPHILRYPETVLEPVWMPRCIRLDLEAELFDMLDPQVATSARRIFVDNHGWKITVTTVALSERRHRYEQDWRYQG